MPTGRGPQAWELGERLAEQTGCSTRFEILDEAPSSWFDARPAPSASVVWAWRRLEESAGNLRIEALAKEAGWSRRRLESQFRNQIDLSPKKLRGSCGFTRAVDALASGTRSLSQLAFEFGYRDQAHLNLEFRNLCGHTPSALLNALRNAPHSARFSKVSGTSRTNFYVRDSYPLRSDGQSASATAAITVSRQV